MSHYVRRFKVKIQPTGHQVHELHNYMHVIHNSPSSEKCKNYRHIVEVQTHADCQGQCQAKNHFKSCTTVSIAHAH